MSICLSLQERKSMNSIEGKNEYIESVLEKNLIWSTVRKKNTPDYFTNLSDRHTPKCLWVGCVDSRVSPEIITGSQLGEMLVYRSLANTLTISNLETQALLDIALDVFKIKTIVICGHSRCGAINHYLGNPKIVEKNRFYAELDSAVRKHSKELFKSNDLHSLIAKIHVREQIKTIKNSDYFKNKLSAHSNNDVNIFGLFFDIESGTLKNIS